MTNGYLSLLDRRFALDVNRNAFGLADDVALVSPTRRKIIGIKLLTLSCAVENEMFPRVRIVVEEL